MKTKIDVVIIFIIIIILNSMISSPPPPPSFSSSSHPDPVSFSSLTCIISLAIRMCHLFPALSWMIIVVVVLSSRTVPYTYLHSFGWKDTPKIIIIIMIVLNLCECTHHIKHHITPNIILSHYCYYYYSALSSPFLLPPPPPPATTSRETVQRRERTPLA